LNLLYTCVTQHLRLQGRSVGIGKIVFTNKPASEPAAANPADHNDAQAHNFEPLRTLTIVSSFSSSLSPPAALFCLYVFLNLNLNLNLDLPL
jgi:hypothetical protein